MKKIIVQFFILFIIVGISSPSWATVESDRHAEIIKAYKSGNEAAAIPKFEKFIADFPNGNFTPSTYIMLAALQVKAKDTVKAIESLITLKTKFPNNPVTAQGNVLLANLEKMAGNTAQSSGQEKMATAPVSRQEAYRQRMRDQERWQQKYGQHSRKAEAARLRGDKSEAIRLFTELRDSNPSNKGLVILAQNRLKVLEVKPVNQEGRALGSMSVKDKAAYDKLMTPLAAQVSDELYKSLNFVVTKKKETSQTHGFFTRRELWLNVMVSFDSLDTLINQYDTLESVIKKHIKKQLESVEFTRALRVNANYSFMVGDKFLVNTTATYDKVKWVFKANTAKEELAAKLDKLNNQAKETKLAKSRVNQLPAIAEAAEKSEREISELMQPIRKKADALLSGWTQYQNQKLSSLPRREYQSDMVDFARDEAPELLSPIVDAALFKFTKIAKDNLAEYNNWDNKVLKPIRKLLDDGLLIWDYGFNVNALSGTSKDHVDSEMHAELAQLVRTLDKYQYPWVQRNRAKKVVVKPTFKTARSASELSVSSFTSEGLNYETELMAIYLGDFKNSRLEKNSTGLSDLFNKYVNAYGKYCDAYLPSNKVAITYSKCATEKVTKNGWGTVTNTSCVRWVQVATGLYADPKLYNSSNKLSSNASNKMLGKVFSGDPFASRALIDDVLSVGNDMSNLVQKNKCDNAGLKRFENNLYRFVEGKTPLLLPGKETLASTRNIKHTNFDSANLNLAELINDLIIGNSKGWMMNRYLSGSVSNIRKGRNNAGSGSVTASYGFYSVQKKETGTVTLTFNNDLPACLYFFDAPQTCRKPSRRIINKYEKGQYMY